MITDYATLAAAVASHIDRDDLTGEIPRFVQMTEGYMKTRLRVMDMEVSTTQVLAAEDSSFTLPADALSIRSIHIAGTPDEYIPPLPLRAISPAGVAGQFTGIAGTPTAYSRSGETVTLAEPPDEEITLEIIYLAKFTPLTAPTSNWIIERHPNAYFYGTLEQAYSFNHDDAREAKFRGLFRDAVEEIAASRAKDRWGPGMSVPSLVRQTQGARC